MDDVKEKFWLNVFDDSPNYDHSPRKYFSEVNIKGGRTPTASRQVLRYGTKETKADVSIMTQTGVRRFS
jgi:hypothetical protein